MKHKAITRSEVFCANESAKYTDDYRMEHFICTPEWEFLVAEPTKDRKQFVICFVKRKETES